MVSENADAKGASRGLLPLVIVGLLIGVGAGFLLPADWIFVPEVKAKAPVAGSDPTGYACPMYCVVLDELPDDKRCPVCGMVLGAVATSPMIDAHERTMIGLETERLDRRRLIREVRLFGEVDYDETKVAVVSARARGYVERTKKRVTWDRVEAGEELLSIYSPTIYEALQELRVAADSGGTVRAAARERLRLLGVADADIDALAKRPELSRVVPVRAPITGTIVRRTAAVDGAAVSEGQEIYAIADLSHVWVQMEAFESDLPGVAVGQRVRVRTENEAAPTREGRIVFIDPVVDRRSHTVRIRLELENPMTPDGRPEFLPGQRVESVIEVPYDAEDEAPLAIPRSSVLRTGKRSVVYVLFEETAKGRRYDLDARSLPPRVGYEMVEVVLGPLCRRVDSEALAEYFPLIRVVPPSASVSDGRFRLRALEPGYAIIRNGALLLDSQEQLSGRPSLHNLAGTADAAGPVSRDPGSHDHGGH